MKISLQISRIGSMISQSINTVFLFGHPDMSISSRAFIANGKAKKIIDNIFFFHKNHCEKSFLVDVEFAKEIIKIHKDRFK